MEKIQSLPTPPGEDTDPGVIVHEGGFPWLWKLIDKIFKIN